MTYLLDTNTCIRYLNQRSTSIIERLRNTPESEIVVCAVVKAELYVGAMKSRSPQATLLKQQAFLERFVSLPFDDAAAMFYARIRAELERAGTPIGANDLLIAAIALANDAILVTHNIREFARVKGLQIDDWEVSS